ncbi:MAG: TfoX/Sxy family protein [Nocardioidaceae bacterium]
MAYNKELVDRIRDALAAQPSFREVKMFGGLVSLVNERMVVSAKSDGGLLVRADPERADELLTSRGARPAEMGAGRAMGNGWISVAKETIASDEDFDFWIGVALAYNEKEAGTCSRGRQQRGPR